MHRRNFLSLAAAAGVAAGAGPAQGKAAALNGRWDLTVPGNDRKRAWWLEIKSADTSKPVGSFIGAPGGGLDLINDMTVGANGEAQWTFSRPARNNTKAWKGVYKVHLEGDKIVGVLEVAGEQPQKFSGVRAPKFWQDDASKLKRGTPVELFNGKDVNGWHALRTNTPFL